LKADSRRTLRAVRFVPKPEVGGPPHCRADAGGLSTADMDGNRNVGRDSTPRWLPLRRQPHLPQLHSMRADALSYEPPQRCPV
jgi:hypothetical protein